MPSYPPLPVPQKLREYLADYPECIAEIEGRLARYSAKPNPVQPYDGALWAIEGVVERMAIEARELAEKARQRGDVAVTEAANTKRLQLLGLLPIYSDELSDHIRDVWGITP